ncbi:MAG: aminoglycoside phosphotransferase family protein [Candidatus Taylorbacteria bacterium]|nr:aminoglycoside phosphotransferase family protein [Candidatus Taylorbacteria bacterium]
MDHFPKNELSNITFTNEPLMSKHEVDKGRNERKTALVPQIRELLNTHKKFKGENISVTFSHRGVSSLVAFLESKEGKFVLKIPIRNDLPQGEAKFLQEWEKTGVEVPHILEEGLIDDRPYLLMEQVTEKTLFETFSEREMIDRGIYLEMGKTLHSMHQPKTTGYGQIFNGKPEYDDFASWLKYTTDKSRLYTEENQLLDENEHGSIDLAITILEDYGRKQNQSSYCHYDFHTENIFATEPITVFDPDCVLNLPYIDLGRSIVIGPAKSKNNDTVKQMIEGYESEGEKVDLRVLQASILINSIQKFQYWNKKKSTEGIQKVKKYLAENKHLLEC